jgi:hypothetical protein
MNQQPNTENQKATYDPLSLESRLHTHARWCADLLHDPDKKQLKYNDIVEAAIAFYNDPFVGVTELMQSCDKIHFEWNDDKGEKIVSNHSYVPKKPWARELLDNCAWMKI